MSELNTDLVFLFSAFLLLIVALLKIIYFTRLKALDVYLLIVILCLFNIVMIVYLSFTDQLQSWIGYYRTGGFFTYVFAGASFLFSKKALKGTGFRKSDVLFFIPAIIYFIDFSAFFIESSEVKRMYYLQDLKENTIFEFKQALIFKGKFHLIVMNLYAVFLAFWQILLISNLLRKGGKMFFLENKSMVIWFYCWALLLLFVSGPDAMNSVFNIDVNIKDFTHIVPCLVFYPIYPLSLFLSPAILYGTKGIWVEKFSPKVEKQLRKRNARLNIPETKEEPEPVTVPVKKVYYRRKDAEMLVKKMNQLMVEKKPYLNKNYTVNLLSKDLGFNIRQVSSLLNDYMGISFNDYINNFRIQEFINMYNLNKEQFSKLTIEGIAIECGFSNRFTFNNAFKKAKGVNPKEFLGQQ